MISSKSNAKIKNVKKLLSSSKERRLQGLFAIEGVRLVKEAPIELVRQLFISESLTKNGEFDSACYKNVEVVSDEVFRSLSDTVTPQGVLALVEQPAWSINIASFEKGCKLLLLDGIQDPGNLGTILRTSEAAGVDLVVMSEDCVDIFNPKVIRSTMGSIFRVPFVIDDLVAVIEMLKAESIKVYGAALEGSSDFRKVEFEKRSAIVIGNEGNGISEKVLNAVNKKIRIPMKGQIESLNAAVSTAVLLYHIFEN